MSEDPNGRPDGEEPPDAEIDEESEESFPASDPPSHWSGSEGTDSA